ncbi:MAG: hypothetical protein Ct9H300mP24_8080 [Candidatus Neomarinimicrobiota bacterium]|nr:MAG: hypothetical protein Ct9H300mP24_8080 [Candidatus Neomarinimicrobiota bacterium]
MSLRINDVAPDFKVETTQGKYRFMIGLAMDGLFILSSKRFHAVVLQNLAHLLN